MTDFKPITADEARGDSQPVTHEEFQRVAHSGQRRLDRMRQEAPGTKGLDSHWEDIKNHAHEVSQAPWGGATYSPRTGKPVSPSKGYAVAARRPGQEQIRLPENASREQLGAAMDQARARYEQLGHASHHLGVFHDDDEHVIDVDPVVITHSKKAAHEIGAATHAVGGAYEFHTGNGTFPPHIKGD